MALLPSAIEPAMARLHEALRQRFGARLQEVTVFGSWARGTADENSDVDVLVVVDALTDLERRQIVGVAYDIDSSGGELLLLSPLCYSTQQASELRRRERRLLLDIAQEGLRL